MNKKLRIVLMLLSAVVLLGSSVMILRQQAQYRAAEEMALQAQLLAQQAESELSAPELTDEEIPLAETPNMQETLPVQSVFFQTALEEEAWFLASLNLQALQAVNPDVLGWISIPGTNIDYPLLQSEDNSRYLNTAWDGSYNNAGSIFFERRTKADMSDYNSIIYGHNMRSGAMFAALHSYRDADFLAAHPRVYIRSGEQIYRYEIFSAYEADVKGDTYRLIFADETEKQRFLDLSMEESVIETELTPDTEDRFLTLSTCTGTGFYDTRWVVQAVLSGVYKANDAPLTVQ